MTIEIRIKVRASDEAKTLPTIPKEVLFLLDSSISIEDKRLQEFKDGIKHGLENLNENDLFNVVIFKEKTFKFRKEAVKPTKKNIKEAIMSIAIVMNTPIFISRFITLPY